MNRSSGRTLSQEMPAAAQRQQELASLNSLKDQIIQATIVFMADKTKKKEYLDNLVKIRGNIDAVCEGKWDLTCC